MREPTDLVRETITTLAAMERGPCSPGEARAADWLAATLRDVGAADARVEEATAFPHFAPTMAGLAAAGVVGGALALSGRRALGGALAFAAGTLIGEDASNGPQLVRRALVRRRPTTNVVATVGDPAADRTLVVLAHHDAAPTGFIFDPRPQEKLADLAPGLIERTDTALPLWWSVVGGPWLVALGALTGRRRLTAAGSVLSAMSTASFVDIARNRIVPGANDNLSGVAVLVHLAEALRARPITGLRVVLASCGAEEVLQGGIKDFAARHLAPLSPERTWVLNVDTVGSPRLALLEGEGVVKMEDYRDPGFRELIAGTAAASGIPLRRNLRARTSTDAVIPHRMGLPTATLVSVDRAKALSNYHRPSDTPEHLTWETVQAAADLAEAVARRLAADAGTADG